MNIIKSFIILNKIILNETFTVIFMQFRGIFYNLDSFNMEIKKYEFVYKETIYIFINLINYNIQIFSKECYKVIIKFNYFFMMRYLAIYLIIIIENLS